MPPRYSYWTIIAGGLPTAFRAAARDELMPTYQRLKERHPDAEVKWFARGRLWESPDAARREREHPREARSRDWRPGGEHRDPRQKFKDAKSARNQERRRLRFERKQKGERPGGGSHPGRLSKPTPERGGRTNRPLKPTPDRGRERPHGDPLRKQMSHGGMKSGHDRWPAKGEPRRDRRPGLRPHGDPLRKRMTQGGAKSGRDRGPAKGEPRRDRRPDVRPHGDPIGRAARMPSAMRKDRASWPGRDTREKTPPRPPDDRRYQAPRFARNQGTEEPSPPPRPRGPNREPRPGEEPEPTPPPRPSEPIIAPPGPPERGGKRRADRGRG